MIDQNNQKSDFASEKVPTQTLRNEGAEIRPPVTAEQLVRSIQAAGAVVATVVRTINDNLPPIRAAGRMIGQAVQTAQRDFHAVAKPVLQALQSASQKIHEAQKQSAAAAALGESLEQAGWFPHGAIPMSVIENADFDTVIPAWIDANAGKDWSSITRVHTLDTIDEPAKESFATAVSLYDAGKYNAALRVIFPEIEACASAAFYRALGIPWKGKRPTSLRELRDVIKLMWGIGVLGALFDARGIWLPQQEQIIRDFCYTDVDLANILPAQKHFPNRHAVAHGLFRYDSKKACINGLLIADVMLRGIHAANVVFQESPNDAARLLSHIEEERKERSSKRTAVLP